AGLTTGESEIIMASHEGKCIRFSEKDVRPTGRDTQGVRGLDIDKEDYLVDMSVVIEDAEIITMSEHGYGKRSSVEDYRLQNRGGKGIKAGNFNEKTGKLASLKFVTQAEDIIIITSAGTIIRVASTDISQIGRDTQGVRVMRIEDSIVSKIAISPKSEDGAEEAEVGESAEPTETPTEG
ncbi:MAG: DNA gyrase subunit A, partial [Clostridia bacterium]|nr:DNA gyrase subunit A [Clostridia bacterium]